jgi:uncharacterized alkaline shock family protein YloU
VEDRATISTDVLARYAGDAAREVAGVRGLVEKPIPRHRGVRVTSGDDGVEIEIHVSVAWGASIPRVGRDVQARVAEYLASMADVHPAAVDVIVDEIGGS